MPEPTGRGRMAHNWYPGAVWNGFSYVDALPQYQQGAADNLTGAAPGTGASPLAAGANNDPEVMNPVQQRYGKHGAGMDFDTAAFVADRDDALALQAPPAEQPISQALRVPQAAPTTWKKPARIRNNKWSLYRSIFPGGQRQNGPNNTTALGNALRTTNRARAAGEG